MKTVYGSETCPKCKQVFEQLKKDGEQVEYVDVATLTPNQINKLAKMGMNLPIVIER